MEGQEVRERLLRLNAEMRSERFRGQDLSQVIAIWRRAKAEYDAANYGLAGNLVDEGYRALLAPGRGQEPPVQAPKQQAAAAQADNTQAQPQMVQVFGYVESPSLFDRFGRRLIEFFGLMLKVAVMPRRIFEAIPRVKPVSETLMFYIAFALAYALCLSITVATVKGLVISLVSTFMFAVLGGIIWCILMSSVTYALIRRGFGGSGSLHLTASIYSFSLTPMIVAGLMTLIAVVETSPQGIGGSAVTAAVYVAALGAVFLGAVAWNIVLQSLGLSIVHGIERGKCAALAAASWALGAACLAALSAGIYVFT
jgi:hypothetical protein